MNYKSWSVYGETSKYLQKKSLFGGKSSLYEVLKVLVQKVVSFDIDQRAAAVAYGFMLAIFPAILFLFTLLPYIPIKHLDRQIMFLLKDMLPKGVYSYVAHTIQDIVSRPRRDILSFGFILTVFAATNGMSSLMRAFNMALQSKEKRNFLKVRAVAFVLTIMLISIMILAILGLILGKILMTFLEKKHLLNQTGMALGFELMRFGSVFMVLYMGICIIYRFAPALKTKFPFFNIGAFICSILCISATNLFSYFLVNFSTYNKLYGSIGTIIGLMVWLYLLALLLILGFEINASLREVHRGQNSE